MLYISTRGGDKANSMEAILKGIASDKGLFLPVEIPKLNMDWSALSKMCYKQVALKILGLYFDEFTTEELTQIVDMAYDSKFKASDVVEIKTIGNAHFLELYYGKTAAFKDMALSILPYLMKLSQKKLNDDSKICILTATSGDTGKAALEGFSNVSGTEIAVFYPKHGVSKVQEMQMLTQSGDNVHIFPIEENFDSAQSGVKNIFIDEEFKEKLKFKKIKLASANSINIGRLVPQIAYYVYSYGKLIEKGKIQQGEPINIAVPTGNFGNILAGFMAKLMGLPIKKFICASNENNVLSEFFNTGLYDIRKEKRVFRLTNSPSMDILISSNLERWLYLASKGDSDFVKECMSSLELLGFYGVFDSEETLKGRTEFYGGFADENQVLDTIKYMWDKNQYLIDTHTAVCYSVYEDYLKNSKDSSPTIIVSTASPYKFPKAVCSGLWLKGTLEENSQVLDDFDYMDILFENTKVDIPYGLKDLRNKKPRDLKTIKAIDMKSSIINSLL